MDYSQIRVLSEAHRWSSERILSHTHTHSAVTRLVNKSVTSDERDARSRKSNKLGLFVCISLWQTSTGNSLERYINSVHLVVNATNTPVYTWHTHTRTWKHIHEDTSIPKIPGEVSNKVKE